VREERDRLVATVAHDLANPLTVILGTIQSSGHFFEIGSADRNLTRALRRIERAAVRALSLVRTLSDAQALEAGELRLSMKPVDLGAAIAPVVQMFDGVSSQHAIDLEMPEVPIVVEADIDRLQRVIENLVANAIKYSPSGGIVKVSLTIHDDQAVVSVRDHGIGISAAAAERIFERGFRAPEAAAVAPGLGLGLSTSAEILRRHGGAIQAIPAGKGAILSIRLPKLATATTSGSVGAASLVTSLKPVSSSADSPHRISPGRDQTSNFVVPQQ
jgi:signal transduction histidine kinase